VISTFQFHFGSIGSNQVSFSVNTPDVSIPLWFDWKSWQAEYNPCIQLFQFHFGSIGRTPDDIEWDTLESFNSTLVRLEGLDVICSTVVSFAFQFHFGSIGRINFSQKMNKLCFVSIPLWFDWKVEDGKTAKKSYWVSIPLWFDWKQKMKRLIPFIVLRFNSTLVRLEVIFEIQSTCFVERFNSTLVRLEVLC